MGTVITEITPLSDKDCFYLIDRYKESFTFPIHRHCEYELNLVENCRGARRIVGDSIEELGDYDLVMVGDNIEHGWEQHECRSPRLREITIQFSNHLFGDEFLGKNPLEPIRRLLSDSAVGVAFELDTILRVYRMFDGLTRIESNFHRLIGLLELLYELAEHGHYRLLSSTSFANVKPTIDSRRVHKIQEYINNSYREEVRLNDLADRAGMTPTAFSRFFKLRTGKSVSDYIIELRLGHATRMLVDSTMSIAEICYDCGFNNVSNFNRIFKRKKGCTPKEFRENYRRHKLLT